ncbi:MAG TPA: glycosyltransferase [Stellaceae bacterium]|nr:glycosyltransferase [Stellaceae bacterium]
MTARRVLFHVQHLLGIGHWRRAATLAEAMQRAGPAVTVLAGGSPENHGAAGFDIVQLPPARAADASFKTILDEQGRPIDDAFRARRRALVLAAFARIRPHVVLVESFPFGRRAFRFELVPLIAAARQAVPRPHILASLRDVLVTRDNPARAAEIVATVRRDFDAVLVHGDAALIDLAASFPAATEIADRLRYTGYVTAPPGSDDGVAGTGEVIVSAGGGAVGLTLLRAALAARPLSPLASAPWRLIAGPHLPAADYAALAAALPDGVTLERFRDDFPALLRRCILSISQAGYNTTLDIIRTHARAIVVPFAAAGETEQAMRSALLAERGVLHVLPEAALDGTRLANAIAGALAAPPPDADFAIRLDGAAATAALVAGLPILR